MRRILRKSIDLGRNAVQLPADVNAVEILDVGMSLIQGERPYQEDRYIALQPGSLKSRKEIAVFAVFDGHAGAAVAEHIQNNLVNYIDETLSQSSSTSPETYKAAIQAALDREDEDIDREDLAGGSTFVLALLDTAHKIIVCADLGDSHVVFAEHTRRNRKEDNKLNKLDHTLRAHNLAKGKDEWTVTRLSTIHDLDDPREMERIEDAGGEVNYETGIPRIGALSMARALGDTELKLPRVNRTAGHNLTDLPGVETGLKPGRKASADLVTNKAHFSVQHLEGESLLFLSSDGIGDGKDAEKATRFATILKNRGQSAQQIADELTRRAGKAKGADNCTVLVACLEAPNCEQ